MAPRWNHPAAAHFAVCRDAHETRFPLRDVQFRLEYALLRTIVGLIRLMPLRAATGFSAFSWKWLAPIVNPKRHRRALDNLAIAFPDMPAGERRRICSAHWENLGRVMAETMQIDRLIEDPSRIRIVNDRLFSRYKNKLGAAVGVSLAHGQLGAGGLADASKPTPFPAASTARSTTPTLTSTSATSARISSPADCSAAARSRATTATTRRRRAC